MTGPFHVEFLGYTNAIPIRGGVRLCHKTMEQRSFPKSIPGQLLHSDLNGIGHFFKNRQFSYQLVDGFHIRFYCFSN